MDELKNRVILTMNKLKHDPEKMRGIIRGSSVSLPPIRGKN